MKKIIFTTTVLLLASCSNKQESAVVTETVSRPTESAAPPAAPQHAGKVLAEGSDCMSCHKTAEKFIGPSYSEIAAKYTEADAEMLADKIIKGGSGNWGEVMMTPHPNMSREDAKKMVEYILTLKK